MRFSPPMVFLLLTFWLLGLANVSSAAEPSRVRVTVRVAQKRLLIEHGGAHHSVDLAKLSDAYEFNEAKLLFADVIGAQRYLLVYVAGPSRPTVAATSYCGAGTEGSVMWLVLDGRWRLSKSQVGLLESCFESAEGSYEVTDNGATAQWANWRLMKSFSMSYDAKRPAAGMRIRERPLEAEK